MVEARLSCNGCKFLFYGRFNEAVQALVMRHGINGGSSVGIAVFKAYIQASFIGDFRFCSFFFAECKIIINGAMKISNQLCCSRSFIRYERSDSLYLPVKKFVAFGPEFNDTDYRMHNADEYYPLDEYLKHCVICTMGMLELAV